MMDAELLKILCCPETHQPLHAAEPAFIEELNRKIESGALRNRVGRSINAKIDSGLVREDNKLLYPIRHDIPVMLVDEAIPLTSL